MIKTERGVRDSERVSDREKDRDKERDREREGERETSGPNHYLVTGITRGGVPARLEA